MGSTANPASNALVFIVEDDSFIGELMEELLNGQGMEVRLFPDPVDALREFQELERKPDLLVTDYQMGSMTGLELIEACRSIKPDLRVILASGSISRSMLDSSNVQPDLFLTKPFTPLQLIDATVQMLKG